MGGKSQDVLAAVPSLMERYRAAKYVANHRQEIQAALDYVNANTLPKAELEEAAATSSETLRGIETTYVEVTAAKEAIDDINGFNPLDALDSTQEAFAHVRDAWNARPDLDSISDLADMAEQVSPYLDQARGADPGLLRRRPQRRRQLRER